MKEIDKIAKDIHKYATEKGFWGCQICGGTGTLKNAGVKCPICLGTGKHRSDGECFALMHSEISEALEEIREGKEAHYFDPSNPAKPEGWVVELADLVIRVLDYVAAKEVKNFHEILLEKMAYNKTRPFKHGKKF